MSAVAWVSIIVAPFGSSVPAILSLSITSDMAKTGTAERVLTGVRSPTVREGHLGFSTLRVVNVALPYGRASDTSFSGTSALGE